MRRKALQVGDAEGNQPSVCCVAAARQASASRASARGTPECVRGRHTMHPAGAARAMASFSGPVCQLLPRAMLLWPLVRRGPTIEHRREAQERGRHPGRRDRAEQL